MFQYIKDTLEDLDWTVEEIGKDNFETPNGEVPMYSVVATLDPEAPRRSECICSKM